MALLYLAPLGRVSSEAQGKLPGYHLPIELGFEPRSWAEQQIDLLSRLEKNQARGALFAKLHLMSTQAAMTPPLVSVIMPAFKSEKYIVQAIESILAQTHTHLELLIFEDGSPDQTRSVINRYTDPRIIKVLSDQNHGVVYARNALIDLAKGKYIALMDADDIADPMRLEAQLRVLENNECDVCGSAQWVLDDATQQVKKSKMEIMSSF
ncbi:glycosyltransferase family 2 protein [bacterium]|nr:glycosyltransferase family 2 protein [bacterium]